jgi:cytochrome P450
MDFCISLDASLRVLYQPFQPRQISPIPLRNGVSHRQPVEKFLQSSWHFISISHSHARSRARGLDFPSLHPSHAIRILELPFQYAPALEFRHHRRDRQFAFADFSAQPHLLPIAEFDRASLHLEFHAHFRAIPRAHAMGNEKRSDDLRRRGNVFGEREVSHQRAAILPDASHRTNLCDRRDRLDPCGAYGDAIPGTQALDWTGDQTRTMAGKPTRPPGPRGWPLVGVALQMRKHGLEVLAQAARDYGDIVHIPLAFGQSRILINHPDLIAQVLVLQHSKFHKTAMARAATEKILGNGLVNSEGEFWRRQRRLAQPAFQKSRINEYAATMVEHALAHAAKWQGGEECEISEEMSRLACGIAVKTLFGLDVGPEADRVSENLTFLMRFQMERVRSPIRLPENFPRPKQRRAQSAFEFLDGLVYRIIEERRARGGEGNDLLSRLIAAMDEDGSQMTPKQLRDETMTLFLAGHETTALTLTWTWYLLAQNPAAESRLLEELTRVLGNRTAQPEDLESLPYLDAVIREALRLYPPAYIVGRQAIEPFELGGYSFPAGTTLLMSQWIMHRDPRYFSEPHAFRPERWLDGLAARLPAHAYFPFGGGPRRCIGQGFAMMEAALVAATLARKFCFELLPEQSIKADPLITLRPRGGIRMKIHRRVEVTRAEAAAS